VELIAADLTPKGKNKFRKMLLNLVIHENQFKKMPFPSGKNCQKDSLKECIFVNSALKIQAILPTGLLVFLLKYL